MKTLRTQRRGSRAAQKRKADKLFSEKIRSRGRCQLAGLDTIRCSGNLQTMHIVGRSNHNLRWDPINALAGCSGHHRWYTSHPFLFYELIREKFPENYAYLQEWKNEIWDRNIEAVLEGLRE